PWVMDAKDEREQKQRIALLFDLNRMGQEQNRAVQQLKKAQASSGAWPWFPGMRENRYITQHIVTGLGHLNHLGVTHASENRIMQRMVQRALAYLDREIKEDHDRLKRQKVDLSKNHLTRTAIQYLYARSFFPNQAVLGQSREAEKYYLEQAEKYWLQQPIYLQGMIALALHQKGNTDVPPQIMASLKENAIVSNELGMYWKGMQGGYYWHQAPIETQALLIEAFTEVAEDAASVAAMKLWLLQQKRTQNWKTTKATVEACYALLLQGDDWLSRQPTVQLQVGNQPVNPEAKEAGTGYTKTAWPGAEVTPKMATVTVEKAEEGAAWGALYWQYFEDLDKITPHDTPLKLAQQLFREVPSNTGPVIAPITDATALKPGDKLTVRIELRSDRDLEYVHLKDMHASGLDHVRTTSGYRYQDGLGYYESVKDASVNFFFDRLPRGTYVFEYKLKVTHAGDFSNGISQIQCLYAPEFTSHSAGVRVGVE
ncbi:MAG: hypothetical protein AAGB22_10280, partial [Bacteroidota bacterium]